jgi:peptide/nickel transport system permease protein
VLIVAVTINFALPRAMPGNPLALIAGVDVGLLTPEQRQDVIDRYGLEEPLFSQYLDYWGAIITGDLGTSYRTGRPISEMVAERLPWTLLIAGGALLVSSVIGITLGAISAWRRGAAPTSRCSPP